MLLRLLRDKGLDRLPAWISNQIAWLVSAGGGDRRSKYRVRVQGSIAIETEVVLGSGKTISGKLLDANAEGARVEFERRFGSSLRSGSAVLVRFQQAGFEKALEVEGKITHSGEETDAHVCGFQFEGLDAFYAKLTPSLWTIFNRRIAYRARPEEQTLAIVECGPRRFEFPIRDLGAMGMGLEVPNELTAQLHDFETLRATIPVPGEGTTAIVEADFVHRTPFGLGDRHGVAFSPERTPNFLDQQAAILAWALKRQARESR